MQVWPGQAGECCKDATGQTVEFNQESHQSTGQRRNINQGPERYRQMPAPSQLDNNRCVVKVVASEKKKMQRTICFTLLRERPQCINNKERHLCFSLFNFFSLSNSIWFMNWIYSLKRINRENLGLGHNRKKQTYYSIILTDILRLRNVGAWENFLFQKRRSTTRAIELCIYYQIFAAVWVNELKDRSHEVIKKLGSRG